ncbi:hypothetical protein FKM82_011990 [Ascaphus truei]
MSPNQRYKNRKRKAIEISSHGFLLYSCIAAFYMVSSVRYDFFNQSIAQACWPIFTKWSYSPLSSRPPSVLAPNPSDDYRIHQHCCNPPSNEPKSASFVP